MAVNVIPRSLILQLPFFVWVMMINSSYQLISLLFFRAFFPPEISLLRWSPPLAKVTRASCKFLRDSQSLGLINVAQKGGK
jgi:hypothetical protein